MGRSSADERRASGRVSSGRAVIAGWLPVPPPFHGLGAGLAEAEELLNGGGGTWERLAGAVGDPEACTRQLNRMLVELRLSVRLASVGSGWRVVLVDGTGDADARALMATHALTLLVESGGWTRLKRCRRDDCGRVFPDLTNGCTRTGCRLHPARRPPAGRVPGGPQIQESVQRRCFR